MANTDSAVAGYYKEKFPEHFSSLSDKDVLDFVKEKDPHYADTYKLFADASKDSPSWSSGDPVAAAVDLAAKPGQWLQGKLGKAIADIDESVGYAAKGNPQLAEVLRNSRIGKIMAGSKALDDAAEDTTSKLDSIITNSNTGPAMREIAKLGRTSADLVQGLNPVPKSTGEAVIGAAMLPVMEIPHGLGQLGQHLVERANPVAMEGMFRKLPRGGKVFNELKSAKEEAITTNAHNEGVRAEERTRVRNALDNAHDEAVNTDAAVERTARGKAAMDLSIQADVGRMHMANDWALAAQKNLTGSESGIPQLPRQVIGQHISSSLTELNPYSNAALTLEPISADRIKLMKQLDNVTMPLSSVQPGLVPIKDALGGLIGTPGENAAKSVLDKYLDKKGAEYRRADGSLGGVVAQSTDITAAQMHQDASALGELARRKENLDPNAARALKQAQGVLRDAITKVLPKDLGEAVISNRREFRTWYETYKNKYIENITKHSPSQMYDPIWASKESHDAFKAAVSPEEYEVVRKDKINQVLGKITDSENPKETLAAMRKDAPGFMDSFMSKNEQTMLDSIVGNKNEVSTLKKDLEGLHKLREEQEDAARRGSDGKLTGLQMRETERLQRSEAAGRLLPLRIPDESVGTRNVLMGVGGLTGGLSVLAHYHPYVAAAVSGVGLAGFTPELLSRLYVASPEVRSMLLEAGSTENHLAQVKAIGKLSAFLESKNREIKSFQEPDKEGKRKELPEDLKKFLPKVSVPKSVGANLGPHGLDVQDSPIEGRGEALTREPNDMFRKKPAYHRPERK